MVKGSYVRINGFPRPQDPRNGFDFNGKIGVVTNMVRVGFGLDNNPVHTVEVSFKSVTVSNIKRDAEGRIIREETIRDAVNWFDESYVEEVAMVAPPKPVSVNLSPAETPKQVERPVTSVSTTGEIESVRSRLARLRGEKK